MIIIETDYKHGTKRKVTFNEAFRSLVCTNYHSRIKLNYKLLNNEKVENDRFAYQRQINLKEGIR